MEITLRDIALATGLIGTWFTWWLYAKRKAVEEAVWREKRMNDISQIRAEIVRFHGHDSKRGEKDEKFRNDVYDALRDIRDRLTRMEARANGGGSSSSERRFPASL